MTLSSTPALVHLDTNTEHSLLPRHIVGRAAVCQLRLHDPRISGLHAELLWTDRGWSLRDLGSRNGTFVDGARLDAGRSRTLRRGAELGFAGEQFVLLADTPPPASAVDEQGRRRVGHGELLWLPSDDDPELTIFRDLDGCWLAESSAGLRAVASDDLVRAGGRSWRLQLPVLAPATREAEQALRLHGLGLRLLVSRDQEHIEARIEHAGGHIELPARAHNQLLLVLARARIADVEQRGLPRSECGWLYPDDLTRMLDIDPPRLHLWIHRARRQIAEHGIEDATHLVERRSGSNQVRIGVDSLAVEQP